MAKGRCFHGKGTYAYGTPQNVYIYYSKCSNLCPSLLLPRTYAVHKLDSSCCNDARVVLHTQQGYLRWSATVLCGRLSYVHTTAFKPAQRKTCNDLRPRKQYHQ
jgi:hypothetical protein